MRVLRGQERLLGVKKGALREFSSPKQFYVWEKCTATNLMKAFEELISE